MILSYTFPRFVESIPSGEKIHSFRKDPKHRWRPGLGIQHWLGSPRNPKSNPYCFWENVCWGVQEVKMFHSPKLGVIMMFDDKSPAVGKYAIAEIAKNDGLTVEEFTAFFVPNTQDMWHGRLIHWTEKRY